jgi:predicted RND superfamily exporter protein
VSSLPRRFGDVITTYSKTIMLVVLLMTVAIGAGMPMVEQQSDTEQFEGDDEATNARDYIEQNFSVGDRENETIVQLIQRGDNVLSKESLVASLEFQQKLRETESVNKTLAPDTPIVGLPNFIANAALQRQAQQQAAGGDGTGEPVTGNETGDTTGAEQDQQQAQQQQAPSLDAQIQAIEALSEEELEGLITQVLGEDGNEQALAFMPQSYEPGSATASAHNTLIRQETQGGSVEGPNGFAPAVEEAQLQIRDLALAEDEDYQVFGFAIITDEFDKSLGDSGAIVGPLALLFVVLVLTIAYRDPVDIILGVVGILAVLVWTFGFMGWAGIAFNQLLLSVPVLLIGLSIDYAIHVFMRHREQREEEEQPELRRSMAIALGGVGAALAWVTATAAIGFLANLTSPIGPLRDFGIVSAFGVVAALIIFGALIPAAKVSIDSFLENRGLDRNKRAFGTGDSRFSRLLASGSHAAKRFPVAIVLIALLLAAAGAAGATQVDTSFQEEDFLADDPPQWTKELPEPFAPSTYTVKEDLEFISSEFQQEGNEGELLIRGEVTHDESLNRLQAARMELGEKETVYSLPNGQADVTTPLTVMQRTARQNEAFNASFHRADTTGDGVPDRNITQLYDQVLRLNPEAASVIYRNDEGEYEALRIVVGVSGDADIGDIAGDLRDSADSVEADSDGQWSVVATGDQVINNNLERDLFQTVIQGLIITLVAVFIFLSIAYRVTGSPASLGIVTLIPVLLAVTWILGSMWVLAIPFNALTGTITSLTIGLGIAYSIHVSSRYELELRRQENVWDAMETTVTGTGGALLGSAATTVGGFGTLVFAILPLLQQFGIITGLTIIYAFLASVLVLPSLLVLWTKYLGPAEYFPDESADSTSPVGDEQPEAAPED